MNILTNATLQVSREKIERYIAQMEDFKLLVDGYAKSLDGYAEWVADRVRHAKLQQEGKMDDLSLMTGSMHASQDITGAMDFQAILDELSTIPRLTKRQLEVMTHTVSSPDRNWFGTSYDCQDAVIFGELISRGLATAETAPDWMGDDVIFRLTDKGKEAVNWYGKTS